MVYQVHFKIITLILKNNVFFSLNSNMKWHRKKIRANLTLNKNVITTSFINDYLAMFYLYIFGRIGMASETFVMDSLRVF